ncbi:MAG TPA: hypothetical protein VN976_16405, partial [Verrucomicrobiae bacterium]|nr:hypothetical protein [Verrucomicrobiae bacterium]
MHDLLAIRQYVSLVFREVPLRLLFTNGREAGSIGGSPLLQLQEDYVESVAVPAKRALRLQQLLKN